MKTKTLVTSSMLLLLLVSLTACQGGVPFGLFATDTPTPTITPSPTPTLTPTITPSPTATFTPTPTPQASINQLTGDQTLFTDLKGKYSITFPKDWWVINLAVDDPQTALKDAKAAKPDKAPQLDGLNLAVAQGARMAAMDINPDHSNSGSSPVLFLVLDDKTANMSLDELLKINTEILPQLLNAKVKNLGVKENRSGVQYGTLDISITITADSVTRTINEKVIIFKVKGYSAMITFVVSDVMQEDVLDSLAEVVESIEVTDP